MRSVHVTIKLELEPIFKRICIVLTGNSLRPEAVYCLNSKVGQLRVKAPDFKVWKAILQNSSKLKENGDLKVIYISIDLA